MKPAKRYLRPLFLGAFFAGAPVVVQGQSTALEQVRPNTSASTRDEVGWVTQRVAAWQPTARELNWQRIGWAENIGQALKLASEKQRPVFLFTLDGHMGAGRC